MKRIFFKGIDKGIKIDEATRTLYADEYGGFKAARCLRLRASVWRIEDKMRR